MNSFHFSDRPQQRHRVQRRPGGTAVQVDDTAVEARRDGVGRYVAVHAGRSERLHAVAHGDAVHVQWRGRAWKIERLDPTRSQGGAEGGAAGVSHAPMPGVVVSLQSAPGQAVREGEALLVIESMKLQMTIAAACDGVVAELPLAAGQTFQRGAVLARVDGGEGSHGHGGPAA